MSAPENRPKGRPPVEVASLPQDSARSVGRGGLALSGAKLYFLALGLAQQIAMSWLLVDGYGALRGALSPASITYNPLITAGVQGMSRAVSRVHEDERAAAIRLGLVVHWVLAVIVAAVFFFAAPLMGELLNSDYLVPSFRILGLVVLFYGCYAPLVGVLNGMRRFGAQAGLDVLSATLRTAALFGGAWVLLPQGTTRAVEGASWGFVSVAAVMLIVSIFLVGVGKPGKSRLHVREHLGFIVPVILAQVILNLLLQADTNTLRAFATRAAEGAGLEPQAADVLVGAYNAGQLFGFLPYQVLIGLTFILFPLLASAHGRGEVDAVRRFVLEGNRIAAIVMGLVVSVSAGLSESLLRLIFPPNFAELGTGSMQILTIGLGAFALFGVFTTVLNSLGKQWHALGLTAVALLGVALLNWWWVRDAAYGSELLVKTAMATSVGMVGAAIVAGVLVKRSAGSVLSPWVALRVGVAVAVLVIAGRNLPALGRPLTVAASAAFGLAYVLMLALMRELGGRDWQRVRAIFGR